MKNNYMVLSFLLTSVLFLSGCQTDSAAPPPLSHKEQRRQEVGYLFGEDFLLFGTGTRNTAHTAVASRTNVYLWQAALQTLSFIPLASVDANGGIIITDWYTSDKIPNEKVKVTVHITDARLRSDAIKVKIHKQVKDRTGQWRTIAVDPKLEGEMEDIILTKARNLRVNADRFSNQG